MVTRQPQVSSPEGLPPKLPHRPLRNRNSPMPKIQCPECDFTFIVGLVPAVTCPMCSAEVPTGIEEDE